MWGLFTHNRSRLGDAHGLHGVPHTDQQNDLVLAVDGRRSADRRPGGPRLAAAVPLENPCCSCRLTRVRPRATGLTMSPDSRRTQQSRGGSPQCSGCSKRPPPSMCRNMAGPHSSRPMTPMVRVANTKAAHSFLWRPFAFQRANCRLSFSDSRCDQVAHAAPVAIPNRTEPIAKHVLAYS